MIYHRGKLIEWAEGGGIYPYVQERINSASIDLCLGNEFINLETGVRFLAPKILINPGQAILATTREYIKMPIDAAGVLYLKSSLARQGLDHALAGWIDPGFHGELTLELHAHRPITLVHGQRVLQIVLMEMTGEAQYEGHYLNQRGPTISYKGVVQ